MNKHDSILSRSGTVQSEVRNRYSKLVSKTMDTNGYTHTQTHTRTHTIYIEVLRMLVDFKRPGLKKRVSPSLETLDYGQCPGL